MSEELEVEEAEEYVGDLPSEAVLLRAYDAGNDLDPGECERDYSECHIGGSIFVGQWKQHAACQRGTDHCKVDHRARALEAVANRTVRWPAGDRLVDSIPECTVEGEWVRQEVVYL